ncbi:Beta-TrCP [Drechslerella dactyloides]|uniref:Beta-TrCP n=1 Tax=Drechslerella dactyloides TaxID=74499 RepID=A0AAD6J0P4_DREDA|nr:Beta-TrCP [Drechslerella dactyloides]
MSSFFTVPASQRKRKRSGTDNPSNPPSRKQNAAAKPPAPARPSKRQLRDEEISSDDDDSIDSASIPSDADSDDESVPDETEAEKRLRLAQQYLDNLRNETEEHGFDAADIDRDIIAERLKSSVAETHGKLYRHVADTLALSTSHPVQFRHAFKSTTAVAICLPYIYTATKDPALLKWQLPPSAIASLAGDHNYNTNNPTATSKPKQLRCVKGSHTKGARKTDATYQGHIDSILCIAASSDGKFVATGGRDSRIVIWDAETVKPLRVFKHHRDAVNGLVFRRGTNTLYSCSSDRTIKLWSLDEMTYVETLFGHQDSVVGIDALAYERCVSVGARDKSARLWKIVDETQLVFRGGGEGKIRRRRDADEPKDEETAAGGYVEGSIDCVCMVDEEHFVTGSDNGSISLWSLHKKKPLFTVPTAHGLQPPIAAADHSAEERPETPRIPRQPYYITALAGIPYSDVFFSGSWDGYIRAWRVADDKKSIEALGVVGTTRSSPGDEDAAMDMGMDGEGEGRTSFRGVVNSLAVYERSSGRESESCVVVAGIGQEMRMGRFVKVKGRNAAVMFVVGRKPKAKLAIGGPS